MSAITTHIDKKKSLAPKLRFKEFKGEWITRTLAEVSDTFKSGDSITSKEIIDNGEFPVYGGNGLRGYTNTFTHDGFYVLIGRQGALCGNINRVKGKSYISEHAIAVCANNLADTEWLAQKLDDMRLNRLSESSAQPGLAVGKLLKLKLLFPTLPEQQKIASFLSAVDEKIQQLTRKKELLEQYKKGVMQQLFSGKLRFKDQNGKAYPKWEEKRLGEVGEFRGGGTPPTSIEKYWNGSIPWISSSDIIENDIHNININRYINEEAINESATKLIPKGSVMLVSRVGVGKLAVSKVGLCTSQDFTNFIPKGCNSYFIGYLLSARKNNLISLAQGTSIKGFTTDDVKSLKVPIPSIEEQQKIASFLTGIDTKIESVATQINQTQTFKKGLLQQMFV